MSCRNARRTNAVDTAHLDLLRQRRNDFLVRIFQKAIMLVRFDNEDGGDPCLRQNGNSDDGLYLGGGIFDADCARNRRFGIAHVTVRQRLRVGNQARCLYQKGERGGRHSGAVG